MKALIFSYLCVHKTEINRLGTISGGIFPTQGDFCLINKYFTYLLKVNHQIYCNSNATALITILLAANYYKQIINKK
jgi:hypothetical protein